jgi:hypothetical protein
MANLTPETRLLLDLWFDGELAPADQQRAVNLSQTDPAAGAYVHNLRLVGELFRIDHERAQSRVAFHTLFERIASRLAATPARDAELELLAMARADGERLSVDDETRVDEYLAARQDVQADLAGLSILAELARADAARAANVDFASMRDRLSAVLEAADAETRARRTPAAEKQSWFAAAIEWARPWQAAWASVATALVMGAVMLPLIDRGAQTSDKSRDTRPTVVNNYFVGTDPAAAAAMGVLVESVAYNPGHWAAVRPADPERGLAPVVWIAADPDTSVPLDHDGSLHELDLDAAPATGTLESGQSL